MIPSASLWGKGGRRPVDPAALHACLPRRRCTARCITCWAWARRWVCSASTWTSSARCACSTATAAAPADRLQRQRRPPAAGRRQPRWHDASRGLRRGRQPQGCDHRRRLRRRRARAGARRTRRSSISRRGWHAIRERRRGGHRRGTINRLDYTSGQLDTLLEDERYDFVAPRLHLDGTLVCHPPPGGQDGGRTRRRRLAGHAAAALPAAQGGVRLPQLLLDGLWQGAAALVRRAAHAELDQDTGACGCTDA